MIAPKKVKDLPGFREFRDQCVAMNPVYASAILLIAEAVIPGLPQISSTLTLD